MPLYSAFAPSILGMSAQASALGTISANVANVSTGGYKRTETRFQTVLSDTLGPLQDIGGVRTAEFKMIDKQGVIFPTKRDLDLAIVGDGFFVLSDKITGGNTFYSRDGSFEARVENSQGYLVDKNGYYLMGWEADTQGNFPTSGATKALRIDPAYFKDLFETTSTAKLTTNLPSTAALTTTHATAVTNFDAGQNPAGFHSYSMSVVDSAGARKPIRFNFTRSGQNTWQISATTQTATSTNTTTAATTLTFSQKGVLTAPTSSINFSVSFNGGSTATFALDVSAMTQYDSDFLTLFQNSNGFEKSDLEQLYWDDKGYLNGEFVSSNSRRLYRVPLANFVSPNNLETLNGMVFRETQFSGAATVKPVDGGGIAATSSTPGNRLGDSGATFAPGAIEQSNVDIAEEFTRMIQTQAAYNANSVAFRTNDELTMTARDLFKG
ncbi:MAG: flagellar hook-basal body complex protein [Alphaproteobacteria bacterium]|nr:flagellar hook-basal body complex protein [Alphaproteobacteria bacterium]